MAEDDAMKSTEQLMLIDTARSRYRQETTAVVGLHLCGELEQKSFYAR